MASASTSGPRRHPLAPEIGLDHVGISRHVTGSADGQNAAKQLSYAPLPADLLAKAKAQVGKLTCNGSPVS